MTNAAAKYAPWPTTRKYAIEILGGTEWTWFAGATSDAEAIRYLKACRKAGSRARAIAADGTVLKIKTDRTGAATLVTR